MSSDQLRRLSESSFNRKSRVLSEYLEMQHNQIKGFDRFNPNVQAKADARLLEQLHEHPGSAGKIFENMKNRSINETMRDTSF